MATRAIVRTYSRFAFETYKLAICRVDFGFVYRNECSQKRLRGTLCACAQADTDTTTAHERTGALTHK